MNNVDTHSIVDIHEFKYIMCISSVLQYLLNNMAKPSTLYQIYKNINIQLYPIYLLKYAFPKLSQPLLHVHEDFPIIQDK